MSEQPRTLEELRILEEQEQHEELALRALKILAVRALLRNLVLRALKAKHEGLTVLRSRSGMKALRALKIL